MKYNKVSQQAKDYVFWVIMLIYIALLIVCIITYYVFIYFEISKYNCVVSGLILLFTIFTMILTSIIPEIIEENYGYYIDDKKLEAICGIFFINKNIVLLKNVYKVSVSKNILSRIFKISTLILSTSAGDVKVKLLDEKSLESLYTKISRAIED